MEHFTSLLWILTPLFVGFFIRVQQPAILKLVDSAVNLCIFFILVLIGIGLALMGNIGTELPRLLFYASCFFVLIIFFNLMCLGYFDKKKPWKDHTPVKFKGGKLIQLFANFQQLLYLILGFIIGLYLPESLLPPRDANQYILMAMLLFIGIQLRSGGVTLRHVLFNKRGVQTSLIFITSSLLAAVIVGSFIKIPLSQSLAIGSGLGWYSLSGIVIGNAYGPFWGGVALLNDLGREIFAFIFIPTIMRTMPSTAVGVGGATSLDFTLPIIRLSGGLNAAALAISFGFIVSVISPILLIIFSTYQF